MGFPVGHKKVGGRVKNIPNKRTVTFLEILQKENFSPAAALIHIYREALKNYEILGTGRLTGSNTTLAIHSEADKYLKIALDAAKDIASYSFPKLKAIEQSKPNPLDGMTAKEKLSAMRQAVSFLEREVSANR